MTYPSLVRHYPRHDGHRHTVTAADNAQKTLVVAVHPLLPPELRWPTGPVVGPWRGHVRSWARGMWRANASVTAHTLAAAIEQKVAWYRAEPHQHGNVVLSDISYECTS